MTITIDKDAHDATWPLVKKEMNRIGYVIDSEEAGHLTSVVIRAYEQAKPQQASNGAVEEQPDESSKKELSSVLKKLWDIQSRAMRHKHSSDLKKYLVMDLEYINDVANEASGEIGKVINALEPQPPAKPQQVTADRDALVTVREALRRTQVITKRKDAKGCFSAEYIICITESLSLLDQIIGRGETVMADCDCEVFAYSDGTEYKRHRCGKTPATKQEEE